MKILTTIGELDTDLGNENLPLNKYSIDDKVAALPRLCRIAIDHEIKSTIRPDLHIILLPEFYFADHQNERATEAPCYAAVTQNQYLSIRNSITNISSNYRHFLLIPGTCFWQIPVQRRIDEMEKFLIKETFGMPKAPEKHYNYEYQKKFEPAIPSVRSSRLNHRKGLVNNLKEEKDVNILRTVRFLRNEAMLFKGGRCLGAYQKITPDESEYSSAKAAFVSGSENPYCQPVFEINGVSIGIEICADHCNSVLKTRRNTGGVDLQIVMSAYIEGSPYDESIAFKEGGFFVGSDSKYGANVCNSEKTYLDPEYKKSNVALFNSVKTFTIET